MSHLNHQIHDWRQHLCCSHSFGSAITYALVNLNPSISDGIILTGFTLRSSFVSSFVAGLDLVQASLNQSFRFGNILDSTAEAIAAILKQPSERKRAGSPDGV